MDLILSLSLSLSRLKLNCAVVVACVTKGDQSTDPQGLELT